MWMNYSHTKPEQNLIKPNSMKAYFTFFYSFHTQPVNVLRIYNCSHSHSDSHKLIQRWSCGSSYLGSLLVPQHHNKQHVRSGYLLREVHNNRPHNTPIRVVLFTVRCSRAVNILLIHLLIQFFGIEFILLCCCRCCFWTRCCHYWCSFLLLFCYRMIWLCDLVSDINVELVNNT